MKIAFLIQDISTAGGTERTTCCLAKQLVKRGVEVTIVSVFRNAVTSAFSAEDVPIVWLTDQSYSCNDGKIRRMVAVLSQVKRVKDCQPLQEATLIICQKSLASLLVFLAGYCYKAIACEHFRYAMYSPLIRYLRNRMYRYFWRLVTLTDNDRKRFLTHGLNNVVTIANMISVVPQAYEGEESKMIVSVGRLEKQKGYDLLLQAMRRCADKIGDYCLYIYGEGKEKETLLKMREELGLTQRVQFCGFTDEVEKIYAHASFFVMSSRFEGFPMVLLEAGGCSLPIVSFDCEEGPRTLLQKGGGLLVRNGDTQALADAIINMSTNEELRHKCRQQIVKITQQYSPKNITEEWTTLIRQYQLK